jgi:hypothetical protein
VADKRRILNGVSLDELLPHWHFRERHRHATPASPAALLTAAEQVTWAEVPVLRNLMGVRSAGRLRRPAGSPILTDMAEIGFTVLERTGDEVVIGALGRPWKGGGGPAPRLIEQPDPARFFVDYAEPGWAKMLANFRAADGELTTETRVLLTDEPARRAFRRYWMIIRPFSGLIRRRWLAAIAARA